MKSIEPQLATLVTKPPIGDEWLHEPKLDGYRLIAVKIDNNVNLYTRRGHDWTHRFKTLAREISHLPIKSVILDGEVVVLNADGFPDFQLLQNSLDGICKYAYFYYAFDCIYYKKQDLRPMPLIKRKHILQNLLELTEHRHIKYCEHYRVGGEEFLNSIRNLGLEGIISKHINSPYISGRSRYWLKTKCKLADDFFICGFTQTDNDRYFGSLFLGKMEDGKWRYYGNVGTGFSMKTLKVIYKKLEKFIAVKCPFDIKPPYWKKAVWLKPKLIAEVEYSNITRDKILRHPSFKGLREDKSSLIVKTFK